MHIVRWINPERPQPPAELAALKRNPADLQELTAFRDQGDLA